MSIDLRSDTVADVAFTGGAPGLRADELVFDPGDGVLLVVNNADSSPFATLIQVDQRSGHLTVGRRITFSNATNGAEQPLWDPAKRCLRVSVSPCLRVSVSPCLRVSLIAASVYLWCRGVDSPARARFRSTARRALA